jgi:hypothetical protein
MSTFKFILLFTLAISFEKVFASSSSNDIRYGFGAGYSPLYLISSKGTGTASGTPYTNTYDLLYSSGTSFQIDIRYLRKENAGLMAGFDYDSERTFETITINGNKVTGVTNAIKYQTHFAHVAAAYRWDIFYMPLGLTYATTTGTPVSSFTGKYSIASSFGFYFGFGWYLDEDFVIEYVGRSAVYSEKISSGANTEDVLGVISAPVLALKYFF